MWKNQSQSKLPKMSSFFTLSIVLAAVLPTTILSENDVLEESNDFSSLLVCELFAPEAPEFGKVKVETADSKPAVIKATFSCLPGYSLHGSSSMKCIKGMWKGDIPACQLNAFNATNGNTSSCDLETWSGCLCVNDARNPLMWNTERWIPGDNRTVQVMKLPVNATKLRCKPGDRKCLDWEINHPHVATIKSNTRRRSARSSVTITRRQSSRNRRAVTVASTRISLGITSSNQPLSVVITTFEIGPFLKSPRNNYMRLSVLAASTGIQYDFVISAHCLPDPPGQLIRLGADPFQDFRIAQAGGQPVAKKVCINLKDRVTCNRFTIRFTASVLLAPTSSAKVIVIPEAFGETLTNVNCLKAHNR